MERLVLGYDGSPPAVSALAWTAARCARLSAKVDVVNVVTPLSDDRAEGLQLLADAETFLRDRIPGLQVELHRLEGPMPDTLGDFSQGADLVVVGINAGRPIRAALAGWMPLRLAVDSSAPVCLVPPGWVETGDPITVGIADDESSDAALEFAAREARLTGTSLRLVHGWLMPAPSAYGSGALSLSPDSEIARHRAVVDDAVERLLEDHPTLPVQSELVRDSRSAALLQFTRESSLIVIGTHRRGPLSGRLRGSVSQDILWRADCPVCIVPDIPAEVESL
ncbi:universal stress protein [Microbacterium sp. BK668]|uniref:universal stress protein n=1 Tax=Microbacterium sp. BK668 TaxID=2512118 RepID=UPI001061E9EB|nr:universal stress protein [Microbacterium sp. BK668]TDN91611.1 nucleotide-binding universal stress UspA family protein [Microbacterium sp. BK668]